MVLSSWENRAGKRLELRHEEGGLRHYLGPEPVHAGELLEDGSWNGCFGRATERLSVNSGDRHRQGYGRRPYCGVAGEHRFRPESE
jgi:hypothetical protein